MLAFAFARRWTKAAKAFHCFAVWRWTSRRPLLGVWLKRLRYQLLNDPRLE